MRKSQLNKNKKNVYDLVFHCISLSIDPIEIIILLNCNIEHIKMK